MNVRINLGGLKDEKVKSNLSQKLQKITTESEARFNEIMKMVESKLG